MLKIIKTDTTPPEYKVEYGEPDFIFVEKYVGVTRRVHRVPAANETDDFLLAAMLRLIDAHKDYDGDWLVFE